MFGDVLHKLRTEKKLGMEKLADEINSKYGTTYSKSMISRWENNLSDPKMETVRIMADYFQVSIDLFLELDQETNTIDAAHEIQSLINSLNMNNKILFDGTDMHKEDVEALKSSLESTLRLFNHVSKRK